MNNIKKNFSIRDLENLSGIKAHTIRIWEKRYNLLSPERTTTNIRTYSLQSLQKLLNITLLYNNGHKISKIAELKEADIPVKVQEIATVQNSKNHVLNAFKMAMINFDQTRFAITYNGLLADYSFRDIFKDYFIPLLHELGLLWQTDTITPAHEHFITGLIKQKIQVNIEKLQINEPTKKDKTFVLYLPEGEIHEIGLLYLNYEISLQGYKSIYLGQSIPLDNLGELMGLVENIYFISYFTVAPAKDKIGKYIEGLSQAIVKDIDCQVWLLGRQTQYLDFDNLSPNIKIFDSIEQLVAQVQD
ncbi:MerR family transcriptional regulator [Maribacter polysiphoniae]|uniref:B12 binding protein n=1 Tax=Maribacter polysiphoniae TaxID=429344 RepID=A0A316E3N1_9FLAO|nr:MerR family transcriptional regulator [Maribacter polysiphoniae]MBD1259099.1 MerR family transcriptional regulator [Maribacter polysiphoniae]PWK24655.1 B12 binding protein [Maribacter polysiphoniae]